MDHINNTIYDGTTLGDLFKEIHINSKSKNRQIEALILQLQPLIKNINDATIIVPLIKEYLDVSVKNDEQLVKLAGIAQRLFASIKKTTNSNNEDEQVSIGLTSEELAAINKEIEELKKSS